MAKTVAEFAKVIIQVSVFSATLHIVVDPRFALIVIAEMAKAVAEFAKVIIQVLVFSATLHIVVDPRFKLMFSLQGWQ